MAAVRRAVHLAKSHDVLNRNATGQQVIGDDAPVTPPPHDFGAHDRATMIVREGEQVVGFCEATVSAAAGDVGFAISQRLTDSICPF